MSEEVDYLIAGQGLAGTAFAFQAIERGRIVRVVDPGERVTSSRVAAGIVNPLTGPKLNKGWRVDQLLPEAEAFYRRQEARLGGQFYEPIPIVRLFTDAEQMERWEAHRQDPDYADYWDSLPDDLDPRMFHVECGGFTTLRSGRLQVAAFLDTARQELDRLGLLGRGRIEPPEVRLTDQGVVWRDEVKARRLIWCQGHETRQNPWFHPVPVRPGKGEILTLRIRGLTEKRIVSKSKWLLPIGDGCFQAGATFAWETQDPSPTAGGRAEIERDVADFLRASYEVVEQAGAIRPMANRGRPLLGTHPREPALAFLNGFGSKGVLLAPTFAAHLLDHLELGAPIDAEVDIRRFWR